MTERSSLDDLDLEITDCPVSAHAPWPAGLAWQTANPNSARSVCWPGWGTHILSREEAIALARGVEPSDPADTQLSCGLFEPVIAKRLHEFFVEHPELSDCARLDLCRRLPFAAGDLLLPDQDLVATALEDDRDDGSIAASAAGELRAGKTNFGHSKFSVGVSPSTGKLPTGGRKVVGGDAAAPAADLRPDKADLIAAIASQAAEPEGAAA